MDLIFDIRDFGAQCDGMTDDTPAWIAAIAAAENVVGTVFHPGGVSCITAPLAPTVDIPISFTGGPGAVIKAITGFSTSGTMLTLTSASGLGNRFGVVRDLRFDGNYIAAVGMSVFCVQRCFENVTINRCNRVGLYIPESQNCTFTSINCEDNGTTNTSPFPDANCVLDLGARNNNFYRCQFGAAAPPVSDRGKYNLVICQSASSAISPPSFNSFFGCQVERSSSSHLGAILQSAGQSNKFFGCLMVAGTNENVITINDSDGYVSGLMEFYGGTLAGSSSTAGIYADTASAPAAIIDGTALLETLATCFELSDSTCVDLNGTFYTGTAAVVTGIGSDGPPALLVQRGLGLAGVPSNSTGVPPTSLHTVPWFFDTANNFAWYFNNSEWRSVQADRQAAAGPVTTSSPIPINAQDGSYQRLIIGTTGMVISAPTNAVPLMQLTLEIYNNTGGAMTITFATGYVLDSGGFLPPGNGSHQCITFRYVPNPTPTWRQVS
jgi:hypothetical protein